MKQIYLVESPYDCVEGETLPLSVTFKGVTTGSSPDAKIYRNGTDVTAQMMPSGSFSVSAGSPPVVVLKPISGMVGGNRYEVVIQLTCDGAVLKRKLELVCAKPGDEQ